MAVEEREGDRGERRCGAESRGLGTMCMAEERGLLRSSSSNSSAMGRCYLRLVLFLVLVSETQLSD